MAAPQECTDCGEPVWSRRRARCSACTAGQIRIWLCEPEPEPPPPPEPEPEPEPEPPDPGWPPRKAKCECGWSRGEDDDGAYERCPARVRTPRRLRGDEPDTCDAWLCDECGHSEGRHHGDWARARTSCAVQRCACAGFQSWALKTLEDGDV